MPPANRKLVSFCLVLLLCFLLVVDVNGWWAKSRRRRSSRRRCDHGRPGGHSWANYWQGSLKFECPSKGVISKIYSIHRNCHEDRLWEFSCNDQIANTNCAWSSYQNNYDKTVQFTCGYDRFLAGMRGGWGGHWKDRIFRFKCCQSHKYQLSSTCKWTGQVNTYDGNIDFTVESGYHLMGAYSTHDNHYEDRLWQFRICKVNR